MNVTKTEANEREYYPEVVEVPHAKQSVFKTQLVHTFRHETWFAACQLSVRERLTCTYQVKILLQYF